MTKYTVDQLFDEIKDALRDTIDLRREVILYDFRGAYEDNPYMPRFGDSATAEEVEDFIEECPFEPDRIREFLLEDNSPDNTIEISSEEFDTFSDEIADWARSNSWITVDWLGDALVVEHDRTRLVNPTLAALIQHPELELYSPSLRLLTSLYERRVSLYDVGWRSFEEIVAELLERDGYSVQLNSGRKDGGVDIFAERNLPGIGRIMSVWQAKHLAPTRKVGLSVIRELADTRSEFRASKGMIVTSTHLTRGALSRIVKDSYILGKIDGPEVQEWIDRVLRRAK
jgi:hypothetical protein